MARRKPRRRSKLPATRREQDLAQLRRVQRKRGLKGITGS